MDLLCVHWLSVALSFSHFYTLLRRLPRAHSISKWCFFFASLHCFFFVYFILCNKNDVSDVERRCSLLLATQVALCVCSCSVHVLWSVQVAQPIFITKKNDFFKRISYHLFVFDKMNTIQFIMVAPLHIDTQLDSLEMPKKHATDAAFNSSYCNNQILWLRAA